jgi:hypothetical protein
MAKTKLKRDPKQQLGQFMTPPDLVAYLLKKNNIVFNKNSKILEPSLGSGRFIFAFIERLLPLYPKDMNEKEKVKAILENNIYGVEYDSALFDNFVLEFAEKYDINLLKVKHNFEVKDFFRYEPKVKFDFIIGNPPFGGSFDKDIEDELDKKYGIRDKFKIKKETYSFFTIACLEYLKPTGLLSFILSDTFLTISTMEGLRRFAFNKGGVSIKTLEYFSEETKYGMAILTVDLANPAKFIMFNDNKINIKEIEMTPNYSWKVNKELSKYFTGIRLDHYILASSGMTVGKNEFFLRDIDEKGKIAEPYDFNIINEKITLEKEISKARLGKIGDKKRIEIIRQEKAGATVKGIEIKKKADAGKRFAPKKDYLFYNKANPSSFYAKPKTVIYWKNEGEAVYLFKKMGPWYLHGIGGKSFFKKEGITWNLIATSIKARYLPVGYILDSGAPVAILRDKVNAEELCFILGWLNTSLATYILKQVINHTKNIQGKDIEKMPYPIWVSEDKKKEAIKLVKELVNLLQLEELEESRKKVILERLEKLYAYTKHT